ncbi:unnamed protein product [Thlaspi arvense]|uniref:Phorbol-ester/DAG-type domain-containing protein n=1 Tax=Thlaspi arvense TaxID=13288 RepID=A0AAU9RQT3_THLAR|nr:unnamed protein product [Thlaspi arvense]
MHTLIKDCMHSPYVIKISRHHYRISYVSSLRSGKWLCGVCRQNIDGGYGAYNCDKCSDYAFHSRCALRKGVWDGEELKGVPEKDDITQDAPPFDIIIEGVLHYFLGDNILFDENKLCQACVLPIFEGDSYSCIECEFILHETCVKARRRIQHTLHPHPLTLTDESDDLYEYGSFQCSVCGRSCGGFVYRCPIKECYFELDHDKHFLTISWGKELCENYWCEECENNLKDTSTKLFYWCNDCCPTLHIDCLLSKDPYLRPGQLIIRDIQILSKSNLFRPICVCCKNTCQGKRFTRDNHTACSIRCAFKIFD